MTQSSTTKTVVKPSLRLLWAIVVLPASGALLKESAGVDIKWLVALGVFILATAAVYLIYALRTSLVHAGD